MFEPLDRTGAPKLAAPSPRRPSLTQVVSSLFLQKPPILLQGEKAAAKAKADEEKEKAKAKKAAANANFDLLLDSGLKKGKK